MNQKAQTCRFCKQICSTATDHLKFCPYGHPVAIQIYETGRQAGALGSGSAHPNDPTYMLGFNEGTRERNERMFPEEAPVDRPRHTLPSVTETLLAMDERRAEPPIVPDPFDVTRTEFETADIPPVLQPFDAFKKEMMAREGDLY